MTERSDKSSVDVAPETPDTPGGVVPQTPETPARSRPPSVLGAVAGAPAWVRYALLVVGLAVALWLPNGLYPAVAVDIACWALFAVSVDLLLGYTGLLSFGHAAFWGTSAYVTGLVAIHAGLPFPLAVLAGPSPRRRCRTDRLPRGTPDRHLLRHGHPGLRPDDLLRRERVAGRDPG